MKTRRIKITAGPARSKPGPYGHKFPDNRLVFILSDGKFNIFESTEGHSVGGYESLERISAMTLHCREATMGLSGQAWSVWDGKTWEHHEARKPVKTRADRMASLFGEEEEKCTCPGPEGIVAFACPEHGCEPPKKTATDLFEDTYIPSPEAVALIEEVQGKPKKTAADLF